MNHFKNANDGFTLIEILFALTIFAMIMTPLFVLQGIITKGVGTWTRNLQRTSRAHNFLIQTMLEQSDAEETNIEKKIPYPKIKLRFSKQKADLQTKKLYIRQSLFSKSYN
jgi:prepilin-type N-terminal cleavage/methylation domain-containing protein